MSVKKISDTAAAFFTNSRYIFLTALISGAILSTLSLFFIYDIYRDVAAVYAYHAREISAGNWQAGWVGRVPMLHILLSGCLAKISGLEAFRACVAVSSLFYVLTVFPLRSFLERYVSPLLSAWGCLLFIFAPRIIRFSVSGLLDSGRYFFLMTSILFLFRLSDRQFKLRDALLFGLSLAGLSVSRGEGLLIALMMLAGYPVLTMLKQKRIRHIPGAGKIIAAWSLSMLFFAVGLLPFCYGNWKNCNGFVPDMRLKELPSLLSKNKSQNVDAAAQTGGKDDISLRIFDPEPQSGGFPDALKDTLRGACELYLILAVCGAALLIKQKKWSWEFTVLSGMCFTHIIIYGCIVSAHRYSIYLVPVFMPFTVTGASFLLTKISDFLKRKYPGVCSCSVLLFALAVSVLFLCQAMNGMKCVTERKQHKYSETVVFIRKYIAENFSGRRCRIAALDCSDTVYRSGAVAWWGYKNRELAGHDFEAFDLLLLQKGKERKLLELFSDMQEIPVPENLPVRLFRKTHFTR